ncbi:MAG TPA: hypothetical protein VKB93_02715 [Thermoanaerobaculia bacterium]|nr:hypothetical protein [Thermoanaerobaculia bacterium]
MFTNVTVIDSKWLSLGGADGVVGDVLPRKSEALRSDGVGSARQFQNGWIFFKPAVCAHEVHGAILFLWGRIGVRKIGVGLSDLRRAGGQARKRPRGVPVQRFWPPNPALKSWTVTS